MLNRIMFLLLLLMLNACSPGGEFSGSEDATAAVGHDDEGDGDGDEKCLSNVDFFASNIEPVLENNCMLCHIAEGAAGDTRAVYNGDLEHDFQVVANVLELTDTANGMPLLLLKASNQILHGGGVAMLAGSEDYQAFEALVERLNSSSSCEKPLPDEEENLVCEGLQAMYTPLKRLTHHHYRNVINTLFNGNIAVQDAFPKSAAGSGASYTNAHGNNSMSDNDVLLILNAAEAIALQAVESTVVMNNILSMCTIRNDACASQFITQFGAKAYRRPLRAAERDALYAIYTAAGSGSETLSFEERIAAVVIGMLQAPQFIYLLESYLPNSNQLDDYSIANRLAFLIWDDMPDDVLFQAAADRALRSVEQITAQATRMLNHSKSQALARFYREWLELNVRGNEHKNADLYDAYDEHRRTSMDEEFDRFVIAALNAGSGGMRYLFTSNRTEVNDTLSELYGQGGSVEPDDWRVTNLPASEYGGVLTKPAWTSRHAGPSQSAPVLRGKLVSEKILCRGLPPQPAIVQPSFPDNATPREKTEIVMAAQGCSVCHVYMDALGLGFENYDAIGRFITQYPFPGLSDNQIDNSGEILDRGDFESPGVFNGALELSQRLQDSALVGRCLSRQHFEYFFEDVRSHTARCNIRDVADGFTGGEYDLKNLLLELVSSDAFRYSLVEVQ